MSKITKTKGLAVLCAVFAKGWWWLLHAGGVDEPPVAYGRPAHAQHVYLPFYQGHMTYTTRKSHLVHCFL